MKENLLDIVEATELPITFFFQTNYNKRSDKSFWEKLWGRENAT